jgi:hypothetical protein
MFRRFGWIIGKNTHVGENMRNDDEYEDIYEDVIIYNYGIPVIIADVLVRKHKSSDRKIYFNHPDSIKKIEEELKGSLQNL